MTDTIRSSLEWILQQWIEAEATAVIGAAPHERSESRTVPRNGHCPKLVSTTACDVEFAFEGLLRGEGLDSNHDQPLRAYLTARRRRPLCESSA